jgi:hypothetical protein
MSFYRRQRTPKTLRRVPRPTWDGVDSPWERQRLNIHESRELPTMSPMCSLCTHWHLGSNRACDAFPGPRAIPLDIWLGHTPHTSPVPGDRGIQYENVAPLDADATPSLDLNPWLAEMGG